VVRRAAVLNKGDQNLIGSFASKPFCGWLINKDAFKS
jgi:hypothetical protein